MLLDANPCSSNPDRMAWARSRVMESPYISPICESSSLYPLNVSVPPKISHRHLTAPLYSEVSFEAVLSPKIIFTGSPLSGRRTTFPARLIIFCFNSTVYSVTTFQKSHVSETMEIIPEGYIDEIRRSNVSISDSSVPIHITECSVAGTEQPIVSFSEFAL